MPTQMDVFDFDGTLVNTPLDTPENRRKYEENKGIPWLIDKETARKLSAKHRKHIGMRRGWYGRRETLEPPLVPDPTPKALFVPGPCLALKESRKDEDKLTIVMTGRHLGLRHQVLRIAKDGKLFDVKKKGSSANKDLHCENADANVICEFLGSNGPAIESSQTKPSETLPWKIWCLEKYLNLHPDITKVVFWEDREAHVKEFRALSEVWPLEIEVIHVTG